MASSWRARSSTRDPGVASPWRWWPTTTAVSCSRPARGTTSRADSPPVGRSGSGRCAAYSRRASATLSEPEAGGCACACALARASGLAGRGEARLADVSMPNTRRPVQPSGGEIERIGDPVSGQVADEGEVVDRAVLDAAVFGLQDDELPGAAVLGGIVGLLAVIDGDLAVAAAVDDEERAGDVLRHVLQGE